VKWWTIAVKKRIEMSPSFATAQKPGVIGDPTRATLSLKINGRAYSVQVPDDMPLLWVLRDLLGLKGHQIRMRNCSMRRVYRARGWPARSILHVASGDVGSRKVTTIEAIGQKERAQDPTGVART
jgi:aerobic-type carbon monoxide dehydrogenase small subunit (CoxS/CutS family)